MSTGSTFQTQFSLCQITLEMADNAMFERVFHLKTFESVEVARHFGDAFTKSDCMVMHGKVVRVKAERVESFEQKKFSIKVFNKTFFNYYKVI